MARLTGERPLEGVTPDSLLALHAAGYRAVHERLGAGRMLDVGCGQGFESARFATADRTVVGVDYSFDAAVDAHHRYGAAGLRVARPQANRGACENEFSWPVFQCRRFSSNRRATARSGRSFRGPA